MVNPSTDEKPQKTDVRWWGKNLTIQNILSVLALGALISGFYFNTNSRLTATEEAQKKTNQILQFQQDWMISIGIKTGVAPPSRRSGE